MSALRKLPMDGTFDQRAPIRRLRVGPMAPLVLLMFFLFSLIENAVLGLDVQSLAASAGEKEYIVITQQPPKGLDERAYAIQLLTSVLSSKKVAEEALGYVYTQATTGFSAKLTPGQASQLEGKPGVLRVVESRREPPPDLS